ncbi:hypothetical protein DZC41_16935, partial [Acinetobacter haemolyticus]|uniref:hypothetical protein n=1 Tax=Acinetobacter haemolyticus TaxID=29430 RepID=UPI0013871184
NHDPTSNDGKTNKAESPIKVEDGADLLEGSPPSSTKEKKKSNHKKSKKEQEKGGKEETTPEQPAAAPRLVLKKREGIVAYDTLMNAETFQLSLTAGDSSSWIEVKKDGPNGEALMNGMLAADEARTFNLSEWQTAYIEIGSTPNVTMKIN